MKAFQSLARLSLCLAVLGLGTPTRAGGPDRDHDQGPPPRLGPQTRSPEDRHPAPEPDRPSPARP